MSFQQKVHPVALFFLNTGWSQSVNYGYFPLTKAFFCFLIFYAGERNKQSNSL